LRGTTGYNIALVDFSHVDTFVLPRQPQEPTLPLVEEYSASSGPEIGAGAAALSQSLR
jgi:hypothetical protein